MKVQLGKRGDNSIQFLVEAETDAERIVLAVFAKEAETRKTQVHSVSIGLSGSVGPTAFTFGTVGTHDVPR